MRSLGRPVVLMRLAMGSPARSPRPAGRSAIPLLMVTVAIAPARPRVLGRARRPPLAAARSRAPPASSTRPQKSTSGLVRSVLGGRKAKDRAVPSHRRGVGATTARALAAQDDPYADNQQTTYLSGSRSGSGIAREPFPSPHLCRGQSNLPHRSIHNPTNVNDEARTCCQAGAASYHWAEGHSGRTTGGARTRGGRRWRSPPTTGPRSRPSTPPPAGTTSGGRRAGTSSPTAVLVQRFHRGRGIVDDRERRRGVSLLPAEDPDPSPPRVRVEAGEDVGADQAVCVMTETRFEGRCACYGN
jgi:hypothetical protein